MSKQFDKSVILRILVSFLFANIVFILLFLIANSVSYLNYQSIVDQNNFIEESILDLEGYLKDFICEGEILFDASRKLDDVGVRLGILEQRFGKNDKRVLEQKKFYSILEQKHFEIIKKFDENCDQNFMTILFFYSNMEDLEEESEGFSYILESFKRKNPDKIMIYSFDYNLDFELIDELKGKYEIVSAPLIVVDEGEPFYLKNIDELVVYLTKFTIRSPNIIYLN